MPRLGAMIGRKMKVSAIQLDSAALPARAARARSLARDQAARSRLLRWLTMLLQDPSALVPRCAWCERVQAGGSWLAPAELDHAMSAVTNGVTHGICPSCIEEL